MIEFEQTNYNAFYIKRQEQIIIEQIKKSIDYEVRLTMLFDALKETRSELEDSKKNSEIQNEILQQATRSIEDLTNKNRYFENQIKNLDLQVQNLTKTKYDSESAKNDIQNQYNNQMMKISGFEREIARQKEEMQSIFDENVELKLILEKHGIEEFINKKNDLEESLEIHRDDSLEDNVF
jgi:hypothetical protein